MPHALLSRRALCAAAVAVAVLIGQPWSGTDAHAAPTDAADFGYQPLWPFGSAAEADRWAGEHPGGSDPAGTALAFTRDFLGFTDVDRADAARIDGRQAWVPVGFTLPDGGPTTAATIHLVRFGSGADAPWEVVGADGRDLTVDTPAYGSTAGAVIDAGGVISGVDECIRLQVRQLGHPEVLGEFSCVMAGGAQTRWSAQVPVTGAAPGPIAVIAATGGHVAEVERFAVTGLLAAG